MVAFLITDVRIFTGDTTIEDGSILVSNGKIANVSTEKISFAGPTFSRPGHTLIPGLIDSHIHADGANPVALPQSLRFGVTTVCDLHNEIDIIEKLRGQVKRGDCADLKCAGIAATVEGGWPAAIVLRHRDSAEMREQIDTWPKLQTLADGRQYVQDRIAEEVGYIKLMHESGSAMGLQLPMPSLELQKAIIDKAHAADLVVTAHATCLADTIDILEQGVDGLAHHYIDQAPSQEVVDAYLKHGAHCNPTLATLGSGTTEGKAMQEIFANDPRVEGLISESERKHMCLCMAFASGREGVTVEHAYAGVRRLHEAGVPILCGSDAAGPAVGTAYGLSMHHELSLLVNECGLTPEEALKSATSIPAQRFQFMDRGSLKPGFRADMALVEGNPLQDIDHTLDLRGVWIEGNLCSAYEALRLTNHDSKYRLAPTKG